MQRSLAVKAVVCPTPGRRSWALLSISIALSAGRVSAQAQAPAAVDQHTEKVAADSPKDDNTTSLAASLGGSLNTGNTQAWQLNVGSDLLLVRNPHSIAAGVAFAYGEADLPADESQGFEKTVVGYVRYFVRTDNHRFWGELGYDATYDDYHPLPIIEDGEVVGMTMDSDQVVHSARLFVGYDNRLTEALTYLGGLEGLMSVEEPKDTRVNIDAALRSKLGGNFQLEIKFTLLFDNVPAPGALKLDTQTVAGIIYDLI